MIAFLRLPGLGVGRAVAAAVVPFCSLITPAVAGAEAWVTMGPAPVSLDISSTLAEGSVGQVAVQTQTFTFGEGVSGFNASDVVVLGGAMGAFVPVSAAVYTLEVTANGGTVEVMVPNGAAVGLSNGGATKGDSFANFYQDTWTLTLRADPLATMELIRIPAGTFVMGSPKDELSRADDGTPHDESQHTVTISQDFYMSRTEVTQQQWIALPTFRLPQGFFDPREDFIGATLPMHSVSWNEIQLWLGALNTQVLEPGTFALPTESQWEYACRAGTTTRFNFGNAFSSDEQCTLGGGREDNMWYCGNATSPKVVGQKSANPWGLFDMHGNVWEWCADYHGPYPAGPVTDPTGPAVGQERAMRGGSWAYPTYTNRSAQRSYDLPMGRASSMGFRIIATR